MILRWAYSRKEAVAAHGSNANSPLPGVRLGEGGFCCRFERTEEPRDAERWLASPVDMMRRSGAVSWRGSRGRHEGVR